MKVRKMSSKELKEHIKKVWANAVFHNIRYVVDRQGQ